MASLTPSFVEIPATVDEIITLHIKDPACVDTDFAYHILDEGRRICRKGHFRGTRVQMRLSDLKDGIYSLNLQSCDVDACTFCFEKISTPGPEKLSRSFIQ